MMEALRAKLVEKILRYFELLGADDDEMMLIQARVKFPKATDAEIKTAIEYYFEDAE